MRERQDRRVQPIAIGPIKYVTHDTIRLGETLFHFLSSPPSPQGVRATFPISSDDRWITEEHLRQSGQADGRTDGRICWELIYRDDTSILLAYILRRVRLRRRMREINYYGVRAARLPKMLPFFRRWLSPPKFFSSPSFFLPYIFFFYTPNFDETLLSTFVIKVPNSSCDWRCDKS